MARISVHHGGGKVCQAHNKREPNVIEKEDHIDLEKTHETWIDIPERIAYDRIFGEAVREYNEKQQRNDLKINSYFLKIQHSAKQHTSYELIVGLYPEKEKGEEVPEEVSKELCREYLDGFRERYPSLEVIGAYFHADEQGRAPHMHLDYIPVSHNCNRGLRTQNGLNAALKECGIERNGRITPEMKFQEKERQEFEKLCRERGYEIEHPQAGKGSKHLEKEAYIAEQKRQEAEREREKEEERLERLEARVQQITAEGQDPEIKVRSLPGGNACIIGTKEEVEKIKERSARCETQIEHEKGITEREIVVREREKAAEELARKLEDQKQKQLETENALRGRQKALEGRERSVEAIIAKEVKERTEREKRLLERRNSVHLEEMEKELRKDVERESAAQRAALVRSNETREKVLERSGMAKTLEAAVEYGNRCAEAFERNFGRTVQDLESFEWLERECENIRVEKAVEAFMNPEIMEKEHEHEIELEIGCERETS